MSKKVLILSSSPRRGGNSDTLYDELTRRITEAGNEVKRVSLRDKITHYCTGCGVCNQCKKPRLQRDDAAEVIGRMLSADVIVLAIPAYSYAMSAQLKTLLDRCCGPYTEMINEEFYSLAFVAGGREELPYLEHVFNNLMGFIDCLENPIVKSRVLAIGAWRVGEIKGNLTLVEVCGMGKQIS